MDTHTNAPEHGALLVAQIGIDQTAVTLIDLVDDTYRMVARAASPSTFGPPDDDPTTAILAALRSIEHTTSRELLHGDELIYPQNEVGNGVDGVVVTTSAVEPLPVAIVGLTQHASVRSAVAAARSTYTMVAEPISLDTGGGRLGDQIVALAQRRPEIVIVAGGTEGGSTTPSLRLAHMVGMLARHGLERPVIVYAGNSAAAEQVKATIGDAAQVEVVDNLQPDAKRARLEPTRATVRRQFQERRVTGLPGAERLRKLHSKRLGSVAEDQSVMVRFIAERFGRNVMAISADSAATVCQMASEGHYSEAIFGRLGTRLGALAVLEQRGAAAIQRWLPFEITENDLRNRLLNRVLRPRQTPSDLDDLLLDYALLRESIGLAYATLRDERPVAPYDLVIAGGALADAPRPGLAALALLDALQPTQGDSALAINLYLDRFGLLAASGALAHLDADAAICVLENDMLNNLPLATVVVPHGDLAPGKKIAEVELRPTSGDSISATVKAGEIVRLPLRRGQRATLRIKPVGGIAIGQNKPGAEVLSDEAAIMGSALGVIVDARPRPLTLPEAVEARRDLLLQWSSALDALPPVSAFASADAEEPTPIVERTSTEQTEHSAEDIAALREELVVPQQKQPKRGFFRRA